MCVSATERLRYSHKWSRSPVLSCGETICGSNGTSHFPLTISRHTSVSDLATSRPSCIPVPACWSDIHEIGQRSGVNHDTVRVREYCSLEPEMSARQDLCDTETCWHIHFGTKGSTGRTSPKDFRHWWKPKHMSYAYCDILICKCGR